MDIDGHPIKKICNNFGGCIELPFEGVVLSKGNLRSITDTQQDK